MPLARRARFKSKCARNAPSSSAMTKSSKPLKLPPWSPRRLPSIMLNWRAAKKRHAVTLSCCAVKKRTWLKSGVCAKPKKPPNWSRKLRPSLLNQLKSLQPMKRKTQPKRWPMLLLFAAPRLQLRNLRPTASMPRPSRLTLPLHWQQPRVHRPNLSKCAQTQPLPKKPFKKKPLTKLQRPPKPWSMMKLHASAI